MEKKNLFLVMLILPFAAFAQWNNSGNNTSTGSLTLGGSFSTSANYGLIIQATGDAIINRGSSSGNVVISSGGGSSEIRLNFSYGAGTGGVSIFDGGTARNANLKVTSAGHLIISPSGNGALGAVGIGTDMPYNPNGYKLAVNGIIGAHEIVVETSSTTWPDYVFAQDYDLKSLAEVADFIRTNKHLPDVPSQEEMEKNGHHLGEMDVILLKKVEELTLYLLEANRKIEELNKQVAELRSK